MKQSKFYSAAIALLLIAFFTTGWVSPTPATRPTPVTITCPFDLTGGTFPNLIFTGTFTAAGLPSGSTTGTAEMDANFKATNANNSFGQVIHCLWTLTDAYGTITLHEYCVLATSAWQGRWEIVSGTGAYANLRGNGSSLMPATYGGVASPFWEVLTGVIY